MTLARSRPAGAAPTCSHRLLFSVSISQLGISVVYGAVPGVLLALQVQDLVGDEHKVGVLSLLTLLGAVAALVAQPLAGSLSDRTHTRSGSRTPFVVGGSILATPLLWGMGWVESLVLLAVLYIASEFALSAAQGPLAAVLPDRVPPGQRGRFSSALGLGMMLGSTGGTLLGSAVAADVGLAYVVVGLLPVALASTRLFVAPDGDNRSTARAPVERTGVRWWRGLLVSPRAHPDFWWVFGSRTLTYAGFFVVQGYHLYLLDDYIGLAGAAVDAVPLVAAITAAGVCLTTVPAGILSDRLGRRRVFVVSAATVMAAAMLVPPVSPTLAGYLTMTAATGLAFGCFEAVDTALITLVLPRSGSYAQDLGVVNVASIAPQILSPVLAGTIVLSTDSYVLVFPAAAVLVLLGGFLVLFVRSVR